MQKKVRAKILIKENQPLLHKRIQFEFAMFFAKNHPRQINRDLRDLLLEFLIIADTESRTHFDGGISKLKHIINVLDKIEEYQPLRSVKQVLKISEKGNYYPELNRDDLEEDLEELKLVSLKSQTE